MLLLWLFYEFSCEIKIIVFIKNMAKFWANVCSRMGRYPVVFVVWGFLRNLYRAKGKVVHLGNLF